MIELLNMYRSPPQPFQAIICTLTVWVKIARPVIHQRGGVRRSTAGGLVQRDDGLWSIGWDGHTSGPFARTQKKGRTMVGRRGLPAPLATTSQPYWTILPPWGPGLTIPRKQCERVSGARLFLPPGSTSSTSSMAQAASAPKFRPDPPSQYQDSPVRREPGGAWPPTPGRGMWPPLLPGFGGRRLSRSALVR